jgi:hypothetical protein
VRRTASMKREAGRACRPTRLPMVAVRSVMVISFVRVSGRSGMGVRP